MATPISLEPPKELVRIHRLRAGGIALVGIAFCGMVFVLALVLREMGRANERATTAEAVTNCYRALTISQDKIEGEIDIRGWQALLGAYLGATDDQISEQANNLKSLVEDWEEAADRRTQGASICEQEKQ